MKPFVELGFMPSAMAAVPRHFLVARQRDQAEGFQAVGRFHPRLPSRICASVTATPRCAPGIFGSLERTEPARLFRRHTARLFRPLRRHGAGDQDVSPAYKVGGPATAGWAWVPEFIHFCVTNHAPVDFISTHTYAVMSGYLDENGNAGTVFSPDRSSIYGDVIRVRQQIAGSAKPDLELHFTEWSASYTPADPIHDSYHSAAFILDKLKNSVPSRQSMSYWVFTDIFEEAGPRWTPFHGGFGLINTRTSTSRVLRVSVFEPARPDGMKNSDPASWICTDATGGIQALVWDFTITHPGTNVINQVYYKRDLPSLPKNKVTLNLTNVPRQIRVGNLPGWLPVNEPYATYLDLGSPAQLTKAQVAKYDPRTAAHPSPDPSSRSAGMEKFNSDLT